MNASRAAIGSKLTGAPIAISARADGWVPSPGDLSTSYGGTTYATTPGGTRIAYDRSALMYIRNSPLSKTPTNLPVIPGVTAPEEARASISVDPKEVSAPTALRGDEEEDDDEEGLFPMD